MRQAIWNSENVNKLSKIIANYMDTLNILWSIRACLLSIPLSSPARSCMNSTTSHDPLELFVSSGSSNRDSSLCLKYTYLSYSLSFSCDFANVMVTTYFAPYLWSVIPGSILDRIIWKLVYRFRYVSSWCSELLKLQFNFFDFPNFYT